MTPPVTDEEIQAQLAGESLRGPRKFRDQFLAELKKGLRDLKDKIVAPDDTAAFHDCALIYILERAYSDDPTKQFAARRALQIESTDTSVIRTNVTLWMDELSDDDLAETRRLTDEILGIVKLAEVRIAEKKSSASPECEEPSPTTTPLPSCPSPAAPAGPPTSSAGN